MENKKMATFALRLKDDAIADITAIAQKQHIPLRTVVRAWIMQRLDQEKEEIIQTIKDSEVP